MCLFWDVLPTVENLIHEGGETDGWHQSVAPVGKQKGQTEHDFLYFEFHENNGRQAVRKGVWKLIHLDINGKNRIMSCIISLPTRRNVTISSVSIPTKSRSWRPSW